MRVAYEPVHLGQALGERLELCVNEAIPGELHRYKADVSLGFCVYGVFTRLHKYAAQIYLPH